MPGMTKVHPNVNTAAAAAPTPAITVKTTPQMKDQVVLTVWKKSLLLKCSGFTVFDSKGNLVFRVDNYAAGNKGEIVLMESTGKPLITVRRKRLSLGDNWQAFDGETSVNPRFTARKPVNLRQSKCLALISRGQGGSGDGSESPSPRKGGAKSLAYEIKGSYAQLRRVRRAPTAGGGDQAEGRGWERRVQSGGLTGDGHDGGNVSRHPTGSDVRIFETLLTVITSK